MILLVAELSFKDKKKVIPLAISLFGLHTILGFFGNESGSLFGGMYQTNFQGLMESYIMGLPFFGYSLISTFIFSTLFFACCSF